MRLLYLVASVTTTPDKLVFTFLLIFIGLVFGTIYLILTFKSKYNLITRILLSGLLSCPIFFLFIIRGPLTTDSIYYYRQIFKDAPYKFSEFKSFEFKYGDGDSLVNTYNSLTGEYQYLNKRDSLIKTNLLLTKNDLLYLHRKAAEIGFWDFPTNEISKDTIIFNGIKPPRYYMEFNYLRKSKKVLFDSNFDGDVKLKDANEQMIQEIMHVLAHAEDRQQK